MTVKGGKEEWKGEEGGGKMWSGMVVAVDTEDDLKRIGRRDRGKGGSMRENGGRMEGMAKKGGKTKEVGEKKEIEERKKKKERQKDKIKN